MTSFQAIPPIQFLLRSRNNPHTKNDTIHTTEPEPPPEQWSIPPEPLTAKPGAFDMTSVLIWWCRCGHHLDGVVVLSARGSAIVWCSALGTRPKDVLLWPRGSAPANCSCSMHATSCMRCVLQSKDVGFLYFFWVFGGWWCAFWALFILIGCIDFLIFFF